MIINPQNDYADESIRIVVRELKELNIPLHFHLNHYELSYVTGRAGILIIGDRMLEFGGKTLVLIPPRIPHTWITFKSADLYHAENYRYITLQFSLEFFTKGLLLRKEMSNIRKLLVAAERILLMPDFQDDSIINDLFSLKLESDFKTYIKILEIFNRLGSIVQFNQLLGSRYDYRGNAKDKSKFEKVFTYLLENYTRRIKISEPAGILGLNDTAFSHYFKKRTGKSFTDYINELRLLEADALIKLTNKKISEVCAECGFNNLSNFNRIYKSRIGETPADRRRSHRLSAPLYGNNSV
ncbi:MAG TPA: AraC family transcriptional regulator [Cyclobacteriaceae bacterium]|nr:AraC family transcriptional regulator [Cyclobacteriaceae bacterium]